MVAVAELPFTLPDAVTLPKSCNTGLTTEHNVVPQKALFRRSTKLLTKASGSTPACANPGNMQPMQTMPKIANRRKDAMTATIVVRHRAIIKLINTTKDFEGPRFKIGAASLSYFDKSDSPVADKNFLEPE
jgi:hypothetical protein